MDIFQPVIDFFNFVGTVLSTVAEGITGLISIVSSVIGLLYSITRIIPSPLYPCLISFLSIYLTILIYKVIRN